LSYRPFIRAFEHIIEEKTESSADRLSWSVHQWSP
jgi:hypothetical protein